VPTSLLNQAHKGAGVPFSSLLPGDFLAQVREAVGIITGLVLFVVLVCAVWRAILRPEDRRFAYLRVGVAELALTTLAIFTLIFALLLLF
jgi:hypothetical protein